MKKSANFPSLKFSEFHEDWQKDKLGEMTVWKSGGTPSKKRDDFWGGDIPWISASSMRKIELSESELHVTELGAKNGAKVAKVGSILILVRGSMLFNKIPVGYVTKKLTFNQDVKSVETNKNLHTLFLLYWFFHKENQLKNLVVGTGIGAGKLDMTDLLKLNLHYPSLPEQQKIASFLSSVDGRIELLEQKKEKLGAYKKGVMQQIFSQQIRFRQDDGAEFPDWEEKSLGEVLTYIQPTKHLVKSTEYNDSYSTPVLTAGKTFVLGYTNETDGIFKSPLPVIIFDDFTTAFKFVDFPFKAKSSAMKILQPVSDDVDVLFIHEAMTLLKFQPGEHKRHWISEYQHLTMPVPSREEQKRFINFTQTMNENLDSLDRQIQGLRIWKKGLLQQMFA